MDYCQDADGRIFGLPVYGTTQVMYYDKAVFEENGIDPDEAFANWQNLAEAAEKITVKKMEKRFSMVGSPVWCGKSERHSIQQRRKGSER